MSNILDYVKWRGDLDFKAVPLNPVDALIMCQLSYMNFDSIIPSVHEKKRRNRITLREACSRFVSSPDFKSRSDVGALINPLSVELLKAAGESRRFGSLFVGGFVNKIDEASDEQFAAVTFSYGAKWNFIAYRGTDDTIVGWKEDFNLGYMESVPAQKDALAYLQDAAACLKGRLYVGGHSKGGNLAIYAASKAERKTQQRIAQVFNNDGPGFSERFFKAQGYLALSSRVLTFVPRLSVVGMLFSNDGTIVTVQNSEKNMIMQHDPFSWQVEALGFVQCEGLGQESKFIGKTVNEWFCSISTEEKKLFVETVFSVLEGSNAKTNTELSRNWFESIVNMKKSVDCLSKDARDNLWKNVQLLIKIVVDELKS